MKIKSTSFYGNKVSEYGIRHGYVDFRTLAKAFDCVLANDITKLFYNDIKGEFYEPQQINGGIDNSERIEELFDRIAETDDEDEITAIQEEIDELEEAQSGSEVFQYYIISREGADILQHWTNEIVYHIPMIDIYIWGVTHFGTSWDYVLTDIQIDLNREI